MKKLFYTGLIGLGLFEILNVYFIMPMPGSQRMNSIDVAYFLYAHRWYFRIAFGLLIVAGSTQAFRGRRAWIPLAALALVILIIYQFNFSMTADHMFLQPEKVDFHSRAENTLSDSSIVVAVNFDGDARAYPVRYIQYHHQVRDTIAGKPIMVTYCNVCRTGRVYEPSVNGKLEDFRLVGMDHFNAMFEDRTTKSWWRQSTGEAVTGTLKGMVLPEVECSQLTLNKFFTLHPFGKVMQAETSSVASYDTLGKFEKGKSKSTLTRTDTLPWEDKSWVVGIQIKDKAKAYDWNDLKENRIIHDKIGSTSIVVAIADDDQSFAAFERRDEDMFTIRNDSLISKEAQFDFAGRGHHGKDLKSVKAYQEFWHSWKTFHPDTGIYKK